MNGISGLPYSVLQPSFFWAVATEGRKAKRMRDFWSMVGVEGKPKSKEGLVDCGGIVSLEGLRVCALVGGGGKCSVGVG